MTIIGVQPEDQIEAVAALVGLTIAREHLRGVLRFLEAARVMAATVEAVPLDEDELAPAPVYRLPGSEG